mmetsp:Transcript_21044/g.34810  ORF Transcript_21044/g.34810 Transcript_21044/m.34810 type:complete len:192 (+) Transcript_21044:98-673(+)
MKSTITAKLPRKKASNVKKQVASSSKAVFSKLDPSQHARRIEQRRKTIAFGKNTAGYYDYIREVPKEKRRPNSMKHPATPDATLDIPTKRWQGMIKAWRKALHQYDPADLAHAFAEASAQKEQPIVDDKTVKGKELARAHEKGLLVDIMAPEESSPTSVACSSDKMLDQWEHQQQDDLDDAILDDSDDDML